MNNLSLLFASTTTEEPIKLLDGLLTLYKRPNSHQWQCRFKRATGKCVSLEIKSGSQYQQPNQSLLH